MRLQSIIHFSNFHLCPCDCLFGVRFGSVLYLAYIFIWHTLTVEIDLTQTTNKNPPLNHFIQPIPKYTSVSLD